jgi:hypothetical protein
LREVHAAGRGGHGARLGQGDERTEMADFDHVPARRNGNI